MSILSQFTFKGRQDQAVLADARAIAVTAGAGSGKTRVLTGRYLRLLEEGHLLRSLIAITFTQKAAREMRTRIRLELERWLTAQPPADGRNWEETLATLDSARIGTIHSLCAEILRSHPAEAGIDPAFSVLEEGPAAALAAAGVDTALAWAAGDPQVAALFAQFKESELRRLLGELLGRRLDLVTWLAAAGQAGESGPDESAALLQSWSLALAGWLEGCFRSPVWCEALADLAQVQARGAGDKLEDARRAVLARWEEVQNLVARMDWQAACPALVALRKATSTGGVKGNWDTADLERARQAMRALNGYYDEQLKPLVEKGSWALDEQAAVLLPALRRLVVRALVEYAARKDEQEALDFDDLEGRLARLLVENREVRARWQAETCAVLVDEFQDTNDRQRQIVYALAGFAPPGSGSDLGAGERSPGSLFIVGDAKQSIYKFRGADVTVFRQVQADIARAGGLAVDLDLTFRAHKPLLDQLSPLLGAILGEREDPSRPYEVPFAPLQANRLGPKQAKDPYIEFHLGLGEDAEAGREIAAEALAGRLHDLRGEGFEWGDMALLFRASTAFGVYEDALERHGIPFVTVAGRGFYNRPEIRDLLNALAAIADPSDDLALAGLLRSPAIGLSDLELYELRSGPAGEGPGAAASPRPCWPALQAATAPNPRRAAEILAGLHALAGRAPVAEVLKRFLDLTGLPAILRSAPGGERMLRNVEKLLADAHRSRLVGIGEFLAYVQTLREAGLREGEAPVEAGGAVQLMTVHKSKGLEFPLVVIADAAYEPRPPGGGALFDPALGLLPGLKDAAEARPLIWNLAHLDELARERAEDLRLLYVAATRAKEKLLVSGHCRLLKGGKPGLRGWLGRLGKALGMDEIILDESHGPRWELGDAVPWVVYAAAPAGVSAPRAPLAAPAPAPPAAGVGDLIAPLPALLLEDAAYIDERTRARESDPPDRVWRVVPAAKRPIGPAWVVGKLVHEALRRWQFPGEGFDRFIRPYALEAGLTDAEEIEHTIDAARRLLQRFRGHPLCAEIEAAEHYHELPYILPTGRGVIDLLYCTGSEWVIVDFKTDELRSEAEVQEVTLREGYDRQVQRYMDAAAGWLGCRPRGRLVFLQVGGKISCLDLPF